MNHPVPHIAVREVEKAPSRGRVDQIKRSADLRNSVTVLSFGRDAGKKASGVVDQVLSNAKARSAGDAGKALSLIVQKAKGLDPAKIEGKGGLMGFLSSARSRLERFKAEFQSVSDQFDTVMEEVDLEIGARVRNVAFLDALYDETLASIVEFDAYLVAGQEIASAFESSEIPEREVLVAEAPAGTSDKVLAAQQLQDARNALSAFRDRLHRIDQGKRLIVQRLDEIRLQQAGDRSLATMLADTRDITIREWKAGVALALGLEAQRSALDLKAGIDEANEAILVRNAQMLKTNAVRIEEESKRGIVDIETIRKRNTALIEAISGVQDARRTGEANQASFRSEMATLSDQLADAVLASADPKTT